MKDMPVAQPDGLALTTYLPREDVRDAFVSLDGGKLADLREGAVVGTSSLRRKAQLLNYRPDLEIVEFRGNVQTRLKKLKDGVAEATFLAMAGLNRLGMEEVPRTAIDAEEMLPAVAQGCIGIEQRLGDDRVSEMLSAINDTLSTQRLAAERAFLGALDGSCETPIGGLATIEGDVLTLRGEILRVDGSEVLSDEQSCSVADGATLGVEMALKLRSQADDDFFSWLN